MSKKRKGSTRRRKQQHARTAESTTTMHPAQDEDGISPDDFHFEAQDITVDTSAVEAEPATAPDRQQQAVELGLKFRQAREQKGLELDEAARSMRLPWRVLGKLESGDWRGIDSPIYLRNYLRSYADLLGLEPPELARELSREATKPAPLVSSGGISRGRYLAQRYAVAGTYLVITALIVVPVLILGINGSIGQKAGPVASLDPIPAATAPGTVGADKSAEKKIPPATRGADGGQPLMASMAPMNLIETPANARSESIEPAPAKSAASQPSADTAPLGEDSLTIALSAPSWVEVTSDGGKRVEYALLESGEHYYSASAPLVIRLGNAGAAKVRMDGHDLNLAAYQRSNVAYFKVNAGGHLTAPDKD